MAIEMEPFIEGATEPLALPTEETEDVELVLGKEEKVVKIGLGLQEPLQTNLVEMLRMYTDIFAWQPSDMPGIDEKVAVHKLCVDPTRKPVQQKRRIFALKRQKIIDDEVAKLLAADFIFEIYYLE